MSRLPSIETQLRTAKAELKEQRAALKTQAEAAAIWRGRATKAEQEVAEWKTRFDLLLKRTPESLK